MTCEKFISCMSAGLNKTFQCTWKDSQDSPIDLTGSQILCKIRYKADSALLLTINSDAPADSAITIDDAANGIFTVKISALDSESWTKKVELEISRVVGSDIELIMLGEFSVSRGF